MARYAVTSGCPRNKVVIGMPMFGKAYTLNKTLTTATLRMAGSRLKGPAPPGPMLRRTPFYAYYEVCLSPRRTYTSRRQTNCADFFYTKSRRLRVNSTKIRFIVYFTDTKHKTQNTKHKTQNTKHKTQNTKHKTQNTKHKTQNKTQNTKPKPKANANGNTQHICA